MKLHLVAFSAISLALAGASYAQTTSSTGTGMPETWAGNIGDVFWNSDTNAMRSDEEMATGWTKLTPEQQAQARADCQEVRAPGNGGSEAGLDMAKTCAFINNQAM